MNLCLKSSIQFLFFLIGSHYSFSQKLWEISIPYGVSLKTTPINFRIGEYIRRNIFIPFIGEWNTQVFSLNSGITLSHKSSNFAIEYYPNIRYNYIYSKFDSTSSTKRDNGSVFNFLIDHQLRFIFHPYKSKYRSKIYCTTGLGINNFGKKVFVPKFNRYEKLSYLTMNLGGGIHLKKVSNLEGTINIIPKTFPTNKLINLFTLELQYKRMLHFGKDIVK